jgi:hypothetical protein
MTFSLIIISLDHSTGLFKECRPKIHGDTRGVYQTVTLRHDYNSHKWWHKDVTEDAY